MSLLLSSPEMNGMPSFTKLVSGASPCRIVPKAEPRRPSLPDSLSSEWPYPCQCERSAVRLSSGRGRRRRSGKIIPHRSDKLLTYAANTHTPHRGYCGRFVTTGGLMTTLLRTTRSAIFPPLGTFWTHYIAPNHCSAVSTGQRSTGQTPVPVR